MAVDVLFASGDKQFFFIGSKFVTLNAIHSIVSLKEGLHFGESCEIVEVDFLSVFLAVVL